MLGNGFQGYLLHLLPRDQYEADQPVAHWIFFLVLIGVTLDFFQSSGSSPDYHHVSKIIESTLRITLTRFLSTFGYILSGPMDLCMFSFFNCSLTWSSSTRSRISFLTSLRSLGFLKSALTKVTKKTKVKNTLSTLVFFMSFATSVPISFSSVPIFSLVFPSLYFFFSFLLMYLQKHPVLSFCTH